MQKSLTKRLISYLLLLILNQNYDFMISSHSFLMSGFVWFDHPLTLLFLIGCSVHPSPWQSQWGPRDAQVYPRRECRVPAHKQVNKNNNDQKARDCYCYRPYPPSFFYCITHRSLHCHSMFTAPCYLGQWYYSLWLWYRKCMLCITWQCFCLMWCVPIPCAASMFAFCLPA